LDLFFAIIII